MVNLDPVKKTGAYYPMLEVVQLISALTDEVQSLRAEVERLEREKAAKRGPKKGG